MPQFLATHYSGLHVSRREIVDAPHIAKARAAVLVRYSGATPSFIGSMTPQREEFRLKFADEQEQYAHLAVTVSLHRADTFAFELGAAALRGQTL